ncbi:uncharacterized protein LOC131630853 [Vicia villosa]|uniref:uncharacterized protein LOC131630853 n=1 Tax=Vicia villosa TaxID=3911 RepID=UPI00273A773B|nr:uncharacterized protein LOC131630853 [Vicia villosa]
MGRRFKGPLKKVKEAEIPKDDEEENDDASIKTDAKSNAASAKQDDEEGDYYYEEEYPEEMYKQLEEQSFKEYAQKWRDLARRVQPSLTNRELVDMFMGTLTGPFYSHLLGSSSSGFTELILTGERVESGIRSGKIQVGATSSTTKKPYHGKNESNVVHSQKGRNKNDQNQSVGAVLISAPKPQQTPRQEYQRRSDAPRRQFTKINMPLSQALQHLLKANLITIRDPPKNVTPTSPNYDPNAKCVYHSNIPGHHADNCWALKNKIQDMIDASEIEFEPPETLNVITAPMPKHGKTIEDISVISKVPLKIPTKAPFKISAEPRVAPVIITKPGPIPYSSDKAIPWNYGVEVYIQGVKQELVADKAVEDVNPDVCNIAGTSKVTRSGRVFSPKISPNTAAPAGTPIPNQNVDTRDNYLGFSDADLSPSGKNHNKALHISIECGGTTLAHVLVGNGSSLNVLPKMLLDKLNPEGIMLKSSDVIVKAFDGSMSTLYGKVELPIRVGSQAFNTMFYVMDIHPAYSCLLGRPWIHGANVVTSTLHQKLKYPAKGKIVTVYGEEEYVFYFLYSNKQ